MRTAATILVAIRVGATGYLLKWAGGSGQYPVCSAAAGGMMPGVSLATRAADLFGRIGELEAGA